MPQPKKTHRFGGNAAHQKAIMGNLFVSLVAAEAITTTEAKAKFLRPYAEKLITKAKIANEDPTRALHMRRQVVSTVRSADMAHTVETTSPDEDALKKLFEVIGPRYASRNGGYLRILKLGPRHGDKAPMARIEFV
jgi:large subunit ribosomal protein L17